MALSIVVAPAGGGWVLRSSALGSEQFFSSGGRAEAAARSLADRVAGAGRDAELEIVLRDGAIAGRLSFPARAQPPAAAA